MDFPSVLCRNAERRTQLDARAFVPDTGFANGAEFMRRVRKLGRHRGVVVQWMPEHGKGSHGTLYYGKRFTVVQNLNNELKRATLHGMLDQLGLTLGELLKGKE